MNLIRRLLGAKNCQTAASRPEADPPQDPAAAVLRALNTRFPAAQFSVEVMDGARFGLSWKDTPGRPSSEEVSRFLKEYRDARIVIRSDMDGSLRPQTLDEYVGQPQMVRRLRIAIRAAQERNESLPHILFHGGPGLGKTTIAGVIANEMGEKLVSASAPAVRDREEMWHLVGGLHRGEMLFIDEIHRLSAPLQEFLYPVMEDFTIDRMLDLEDGKQTFRFDLPKFTLLAATTHAGALSAPLRDRFGMICRVEYYSAEELARIVQRSAGILRMQLAEPDTLQIAKRSRCTPRVANRLLQRVRDYALVHAGGEVNTEVVEATLELEGIDADGLDDLDRRYLDVLKRLYKGGPAGVEALAASLDESVETLVDMVEPYLIQRELIVRTPRGRKAIQ